MKTIKVYNTEIELTEERRNRIINSKNEIQRKLDKELAYSEDLQKKEMIEMYRNNIAKLEGMLA